MPQAIADEEGVRWQYSIAGEATTRPDPHPAAQRYGETVVELQQALLRAGGRLTGGGTGWVPALEVGMTTAQRRMLEQLHERSNWVITLDRFFPLDYFDSPQDAQLAEMSDTFLLDYSPEFSEGLGHRMMVTTAWREEIAALLAGAMDELGFAAVDQSVGRLLHHLKTVSGRLALQAMESPNTAAAAVGLGVVTAWLQAKGRLRQAILIPVDMHPRLFSEGGYGTLSEGEQRCDLVLIGLKRNIVEATFIEVKWRRGRAALEELAYDMTLQMASSAQTLQRRFFDPERIDGALQRAYLANVLRFYFDRARRYGLFDAEAGQSFLEHLTRLEKSGLQFRPSQEGYIVSLDQESRRFQVGDAQITVLTATDFARETEFTATFSTAPAGEESFREPEPRGEEHEGAIEERREEELREEAPFPSEHVTEPVALVMEMLPDDVVLATNSVLHSEVVGTEAAPSAAPEAQRAEQAGPLSIPLGESLDGPVVWTPSTQGSPHLFVIGIPGQGKSWTVTRILRDLAAQGVPALVLDFHGQFGEAGNPFVEAARPTVLDAGAGLPFSPFECRRGASLSEVRANAYGLAEIFEYVAGLGEMQRDVVYTAIQEAYTAHGFGGSGVGDQRYPTMSEVLSGLERRERDRGVANVVARCRPLLEMDLFRADGEQLDLREGIRNGLVIDLHNLYVETVQQAAGAFLLRKLYKDMFGWGTTNRLRLAIVLDEAHRLAKDVTLPKIMKEGRKFGVSVIVASQGMADFHPDVLANAGTKVLFRVNFPESRKIAGFVRLRQGQEMAKQVEQLRVGTAYVQTPEMAYGSQVQMYPLEERR